MESNLGEAFPKHSMHFSRSGGEERMGKLNVRTPVTSEQQKSNMLLEKRTLKLILLVKRIQFSYLWSGAPIPKDDGLLCHSNANCCTYV